MAELREETRANTEYIRSKGYNVVELYECEWATNEKNQQRITAIHCHGSPYLLTYLLTYTYF